MQLSKSAKSSSDAIILDFKSNELFEVSLIKSKLTVDVAWMCKKDKCVQVLICFASFYCGKCKVL